jgi:ApaG protein
MKSPEIIITVASPTKYIPEQSEPMKEKFVWSYEVTIENTSEESVQLLNRYWRIVDMTGHIEEVQGAGVIGLQPVIKPGKHFVYSSFCQLMTPQGTMSGHYQFQTMGEAQFLVEIPKFILSAPSEITKLFKAILH